MSIWEKVAGIFATSRQDDDLQLTQASPANEEVTTTRRFIHHNDGTVTDCKTGLMWKRCAEGQVWREGRSCLNEPTVFTLIAAKNIESEFAGYDDWRLPTLTELQGIVDESSSVISMGNNVSIDCPSELPILWSSTRTSEFTTQSFWSSTGSGELSRNSGEDGAWCLSFYSGKSFAVAPEGINCVRLVRSVLTARDQGHVVVAGKSIDSNSNKDWHGSGLDFLLREIERKERPSAELMKSLALNPGMVNSSVGRLGTTLLHHAAAHRRLEIVKYLCLRHSANINAVDKDGQTPIDYALVANADEVVNYLCSKGAKTRLELLESGSLVFSAIDAEQLENEVSRLRIASNEHDAKSRVSDELKNALKIALTECALPRGDLVNFVHKRPGLINEGLFELNQTMLHLATRAGKLEVVKWLIGKGARVDVLDSYGFSPIEIANSAGAVEVANYLKYVAVKTTLTVLVTGTGKGRVTKNPQQETYGFGSQVGLVATAEPGSVFTGWSGDVTGSELACNLVMDSDKALTATFSRLSFSLAKSLSGSGSGCITCDPETDSYEFGSMVTLTAVPAEGSIFTGWAGDATGLDSRCTLAVDSAKHIVAVFQRIEIPDLEVVVSFDSVEQASMRSGDEAFIFYLAIANKGQKQIRIELSPASYMTQQGEEIEQDVWLSGLINGEKGASIRAGAFRKVGLVFYQQKLKSISTGDQLFFSVCQKNTAQRFNYTLRCVDKESKTFVLIQAELEKVKPAELPEVIPEVIAPLAEYAEILRRIENLELILNKVVDQTANSAEILQCIENHEAILNTFAAQTEVSVEVLLRIEMMQATLDEVQRQLSKLQTPPLVIPQSAAQSEPAVSASSQTTPQKTLPQVLAWLATQERVTAAVLRNLLLPLDLLPSALVDEINERALDRVGEPALEDQEDEILVVQDVLAEILTDWDALNETSDAYEE
jgi:ankyrin repeat protein